jgi:hypothetical protein
MSGYGSGYGGGQSRNNRQDGGNRRQGQGQGDRKRPEDMTEQERFDYAKGYRVGFGKYKGYTLNQIATEEMVFLDWLNRRDWLNESCRRALDTFLAHPQVRQDLDEAVAKDKAERGANGDLPMVDVKGRY